MDKTDEFILIEIMDLLHPVVNKYFISVNLTQVVKAPAQSRL